MVKLVDVRLTTIFPLKVTALCGFYCLNHLLVELLGRRNGFDQQNGCHQKRTGKEKLHLLNVLFFQQIMVTIAWVYRYRCKPAWLYYYINCTAADTHMQHIPVYTHACPMTCSVLYYAVVITFLLPCVGLSYQ